MAAERVVVVGGGYRRAGRRLGADRGAGRARCRRPAGVVVLEAVGPARRAAADRHRSAAGRSTSGPTASSGGARRPSTSAARSASATSSSRSGRAAPRCGPADAGGLPAGLAAGCPDPLWPGRPLRHPRTAGSTAGCSSTPSRPVPTCAAPSATARSDRWSPASWADGVVDALVDPLIGGIHAGSVDDMSAAAVYPPPPRRGPAARQPHAVPARRGGGRGRRRRRRPARRPTDETPPLFWALRGGMATLIDALAAGARSPGRRHPPGDRGRAPRARGPAAGPSTRPARRSTPTASCWPLRARHRGAAPRARRPKPPHCSTGSTTPRSSSSPSVSTSTTVPPTGGNRLPRAPRDGRSGPGRRRVGRVRPAPTSTANGRTSPEPAKYCSGPRSVAPATTGPSRGTTRRSGSGRGRSSACSSASGANPRTPR